MRKIWDDNLLELDEAISENKGLRILDHNTFTSYNLSFIWSMGSGIVSQFGRIVIGEGTKFTQELQVLYSFICIDYLIL